MSTEKDLQQKPEQDAEPSQSAPAPVSCTEHELKTWPIYFEQVWNGSKNFEVRKNDRAFQKGDTVVLREYRNGGYVAVESHRYTGREIRARIGFVLSEFQKDGFVTFSLLNIERCN